MKHKFLFLIALALLVIASPAYAQEVSVSGALGVHAVPNQSANNRFDNVGLSADLAAHFKNFTVGGQIFGADNNPSRAFYFASYRVAGYQKHSLSVGGAFHTFGSQTRGLGQIGYDYAGKYDATLRAGSQETVHLQAAVKLAQFGPHVSLHPVYTYYHTEVSGFDVDLHTVGVQFRFNSKN